MGWQDAPVVDKPAGKAAWESAPVVGGAAAPQPPEAPKPYGVGQAFRDIAGGAASNAVDIARGALTGAMTLPGEIASAAQGVGNYMNKRMGGDPAYFKDKGVLPTFDKTIESIPRFGTAPTPQTSGFEQMGSAVAPVPGAGVGKLPGVVSKMGRGVESAIAAPGAAMRAAADTGIGRTLRGVPAQSAQQSAEQLQGYAQSATRGALADTSQALGKQAADAAGQAQSIDKVREATQAALDAAKSRGTPTLDALGGTLADDYGKAVATARSVRESEVAPLYDKAREMAAARERDGARIDVAPATKNIEDMLKLADNLPDLKAQLLRLQGAVKGAPSAPGVAAPVGVGKVSSRITSPVASTPAQPLTYEQLDLANRYVKNIAYAGEAEGYGAIIRNAAKDLGAKLDKQITDFVPEHAAAAAKYRELSEPLDTLGTKVGRALYDTEGGLKGQSYAKVSPQDLPNRIFGKRDKIEQLVDGLAGGAKATPEARAAAQAKVDTWVENWILTKTGDKVGADALKGIRTPDMQATLGAVPGAQGRLEQRFGREAGMQNQLPELQKQSAALMSTADSATKSRATIDGVLRDADALSGAASTAFQKQGYDAYVSAMRRMVKDGTLDEAKFRAALGLADRAAQGLEGAAALAAKTKKAQQLAKTLFYGGAAVSTGLGLNHAFGS